MDNEFIYYIFTMEKHQSQISQQNYKQLQRSESYAICHSLIINNKGFQSSNLQNAYLHHETQINPKTLIKILILLLLLPSAFIFFSKLSDFWILQTQNIGIDNNSRLLSADSFGQVSIDVKTIDDVPRSISFDQLPKNEIIPQVQESNSINNNFDAQRVIFDDSLGSNIELVAGITHYKYKLAQKLFELNINPKSQFQKEIYDFEREYYQSRYQIGKYSQKYMCIIVPTYNNAQNERYKLNLQSIIQQQYYNYKVIIIDDASNDSTPLLIKNLISQKNLSPQKVKLIENKAQMKALYNIRHTAINYCDAKDIMIIVDGDDQLVGRQVFKLFNAVFQKQQIWFAYSNFIDTLTRNIGFSRPFDARTILYNQYRSQPFITSHLRAFYVSLFLKIKQEDLKDADGKYYQAANDVAICIPILEMSGTRVKYISQLTYGYNSNTGINNHHIRAFQQERNNREIRLKNKYQILKDS